MRESIKEFVELISRLPIPEPIYEFGALQVSSDNFGDIRYFFPEKEFIGCDIRKGPGVDVILDLHSIDLPSGSVGTVIILDTLEHVEYPRKALNEIYRILKPEGILIMTSVMNFKIHEFPNDFWRFTPQGFESLLDCFYDKFVGFVGDDDFPHTVVGVASKKPFNDDFVKFQNEFPIWKKRWFYSGNSIIKNALYRPDRILLFILEKFDHR